MNLKKYVGLSSKKELPRCPTRPDLEQLLQLRSYNIFDLISIFYISGSVNFISILRDIIIKHNNQFLYINLSN